MKELENLKMEYENIVRNKFNSEARVVFGDGNVQAKVILIGEAPGKTEEELGKAFVGAAGKNLDEFLSILKLKREDIYITNVVKIRPFKINEKTGSKSNRTPNKLEIKESIGVLKKQIELINPRIIVTLGNVPLRAVIGMDNAKIGDYHGNLIKKENYNVFPLYHPASIIYNRSLYETYIADVKKLKELIDDNSI